MPAALLLTAMCYRREVQPVRLIIWGVAFPFVSIISQADFYVSESKRNLLIHLEGLLFCALSLGLQSWMRPVRPLTDSWLPYIHTKTTWKHQWQQVSYLASENCP